MTVVFLYTNISQEGKVLKQFGVHPWNVVTRTLLRQFVNFITAFDKLKHMKKIFDVDKGGVKTSESSPCCF